MPGGFHYEPKYEPLHSGPEEEQTPALRDFPASGLGGEPGSEHPRSVCRFQSMLGAAGWTLQR